MNITLKIIPWACLLIAIAFVLMSCRHLVKPVDGPGMERDSADYAHEADIVKAQPQVDTAATLAAPARTVGDAGIWYMDGAAYVATFNPADKSITMDGGTLDETRSFMLRVQDPNDPFAYDVAGASPSWLGAVQAYPDTEDGQGYYVFTDKDYEAVAIMRKIPSVEVLEDIVRGELVAIVEGEYKDASGRRARITEGALLLPDRESLDMEFDKKGNTPVNVMVAGGKYWRFTGTYDGLTLQPVQRKAGNYVAVEGAKPIHLVRQNGNMGRWPLTGMEPVQHTMLQYLDTKALHYMAREIYARLGNCQDEDPQAEAWFKMQPWFSTDLGRTHLTKLELHNFEVIKAEESKRKLQ